MVLVCNRIPDIARIRSITLHLPDWYTHHSRYFRCRNSCSIHSYYRIPLPPVQTLQRKQDIKSKRRNHLGTGFSGSGGDHWGRSLVALRTGQWVVLMSFKPAK